MQEVIATKGQAFGRLSLLSTLRTMKVGEVWTTSTREVNVPVLRSRASNIGATDGSRFSVRTADDGTVTVTRVL